MPTRLRGPFWIWWWSRFSATFCHLLAKMLRFHASNQHRHLPPELLYELVKWVPYGRCHTLGTLPNTNPISGMAQARSGRVTNRIVEALNKVDAVDIDGQQGRMREAFARCLMSFHKGVDGTTLRFLCPGQWHHERHHSHHNIDHYSDPDNGWIAVFPRLLLFCTHNRLPDDTFEFQLHHTVRLDDGQEKWVRVRRRLFTFPAQPRKNSNNNGNNNGRAQAAIEEGISFRPAAHVDERFVLGAFIGCGRLKADIEDGAQ